MLKENSRIINRNTHITIVPILMITRYKITTVVWILHITLNMFTYIDKLGRFAEKGGDIWSDCLELHNNYKQRELTPIKTV